LFFLRHIHPTFTIKIIAFKQKNVNRKGTL
jgi:hypothetical protein